MKTIAVLAVLLLSMGSIHAQQQIPSIFEGTYLSNDYLDNLALAKCHVCALRNTLERGIYEVIMIKDNTVYSNLKYHDQYAFKTEEFFHNWASNDSSIITDKKRNIYRKVSQSTNYAEVVRQLYFNILLGDKTLNDAKGNSLSRSNIGTLILNNDEYQLYLDIIYRNDEMDVVFNRLLKRQYGIQCKNNLIEIYEVKSIGEISFDIDENTLELLYSFEQ